MDSLVDAIVRECACRFGVARNFDERGLKANIELRIRGWVHKCIEDDPLDFAGQLHDSTTQLGTLLKTSKQR